MGESIPSIRPTFNRSIRIEGRPERLTAESGALLIREADNRLGFTRDMTAKLIDHRKGAVNHTLDPKVTAPCGRG